MKRSGGTTVRRWLVLLCGLQAGCVVILLAGLAPAPAPPPQVAPLPPHGGDVWAADYRQPAPPPDKTPPTPSHEPQSALFAGLTELSAEVLVREVLDRNPSQAQMAAAF